MCEKGEYWVHFAVPVMLMLERELRGLLKTFVLHNSINVFQISYMVPLEQEQKQGISAWCFFPKVEHWTGTLSSFFSGH